MRAAWLLALLLAASPAVGQTTSAVSSAADPAPGPAGAKGDPGAKGETGDAGNTGAIGPAGRDGGPGAPGPQGAAGAKGDAGPPGPVGAAGATGPAGQTGPAGASGPAGQQGSIGPKGDTGATGPAGPRSLTFVCNATVAEAASLTNLISGGVRISPATTCAGVLATDVLTAYPTSLASLQGVGGVSNGIAVHHAIPVAANSFRAVIQTPGLTVGASYSIPVAIYVVNR